MAAPNIAEASGIYGKSWGLAVTTSRADLIAAVGSGKVIKVNTLVVSNVDGTNAVDVTVEVYKAVGTAYFHVGKVITVPAKAALDVLARTIYLEEGDRLCLTASANSDAEAVASGEELS